MKVEVRVERPEDGGTDSYISGQKPQSPESFSSLEDAIKWGTKEVRKYYPTCWSQEVEHLPSVIYTVDNKVVGYINVEDGE